MKKRSWTLLPVGVAFLLCISMMLVPVLACAATLKGTGNSTDPYLIGTAEELHEFAWRVNDNNKNRQVNACAILTADIDYSTYNAEKWYAIGSKDNPYTGVFDGAGKTISGLKLNDRNGFNAFVRVLGENGEIRNLNIDAEFFGENNCGGIVGRNYGTISNCEFSGKVGKYSGITDEVNNIGGIVGQNLGTVVYCRNNGTVSGQNNTGGIVGNNGDSGSISLCVNNAAVTGIAYVGGIAGCNYSTLRDCYNTGKVSGNYKSKYIGGIAGMNYSGAVIEYCHNVSEVENTYTDESSTNSANSANNEGGVLGYNQTGATVRYSCSHVTHCGSYSVAVNQGTKEDVNKYGGADFKNSAMTLLQKDRTDDSPWVQGPDYPVLAHHHYWYYSKTGSSVSQTLKLHCAVVGCGLQNGLVGSVQISAPSNRIYDGNAKDAQLTYMTWNLGENEKSTITYKDTDRINVTGSDISASVTLGRCGGTAGIVYRVLPHEIQESMVMLSQELFSYTGTQQGPTVIVNDGSRTLLEGRDYILSGASGTNVSADYEVHVSGTGNYTGTAEIDWEIARASITPTVSLAGWTFGMTANTPVVSGNSGAGSVSYVYKAAGAGDAAYTETVPADAGAYTVKAVIAQTENFMSGEATADFTIAKAIPTGEPVFEPVYRDGKTLAEVVLSTESFSVSGTIVWDTPEAIVEKGGAYAWTFTPEEAGNYEQLAGMATPYPAGEKPTITEPADVQMLSVKAGETVTLTVLAEGSGELTYQWLESRDGGNTFAQITGAADSAYTTDALSAADDGVQYRCEVSNLYGETISAVFVIEMIDDVALPKTGDRSAAGLWLAVLAASGAALALRKRRMNGAN